MQLLRVFGLTDSQTLTHLALVPEEAVLAHTQVVPAVAATHASVQTGTRLAAVLLCTHTLTAGYGRLSLSLRRVVKG